MRNDAEIFREQSTADMHNDTGCEEFALYLGRCQVDTPHDVVGAVWAQVKHRRCDVGKVVDFGAGDGRFARVPGYRSYVGYEIDPRRTRGAEKLLPCNATMRHLCAFAEPVIDADVCIGNPPYVRNQDLPEGWAKMAAEIIAERTGVQVSGLANAWQYFFLLSLASTKADGLAALVVPYEWVSRPSSKALREYIKSNGWTVSIYRLCDSTFKKVLTTSSIAIVDKADKSGTWSYFRLANDGECRPSRSPTGSRSNVLAYTKVAATDLRAKRGLSPGTQEALVLTEGDRVRHGLKRGRDVVACVTTLRPLEYGEEDFDEELFQDKYVLAGKRCWLIRTDRQPSQALSDYLNTVPSSKYQTSTCLSRGIWWKFTMPAVPSILMASGFRRASPKVVVNSVRAVAVGSVCGIYGVGSGQEASVVRTLSSYNFKSRVVSHSNGLMKVEIAQLNTVLGML